MMKVAKTKRKEECRALNASSEFSAGSNNRSMSTLIQWLVAVLLFCYVPFLVWKQHFYGKLLERIMERRSDPLFDEKVFKFEIFEFDVHLYDIISYRNGSNSIAFHYFSGSNDWSSRTHFVYHELLLKPTGICSNHSSLQR